MSERPNVKMPTGKARPSAGEEEKSPVLQRWPGIEDLLHEALGIPPAEREGFLERACGEDKALRRELLSLIMADENAGDFLVDPIQMFHASTPADGGSHQFRPSTPIAPSSRVEDLEPDLDRLILSCLAKNPRERPASVADVVTALENVKPRTDPQVGLGATRGVQALRQLPAPPADFTGRATELNELSTAVESSGVTISGLQGMGRRGQDHARPEAR